MTDETIRIAVLPGDGIGVEVTAEAQKILAAVGERFGHRFQMEAGLVGAAAIDATGEPLPAATLALCRGAQAVLFGAVGDPRFDNPRAPVRPEQALLGLRQALGLYANLRPVAVYPELAAVSPIRPERAAGADLVVVRELTGGLYFGEPRVEGDERAVDTMVYTRGEVERVARLAFELARRRRHKVASVDKANVLACSRLWRHTVQDLAAGYPDVELRHVLVDAAAMHLVQRPAEFDVLLTENMFGDILSDEASVLAGSLGLLPSASLGEGSLGLYEPVHGSAPDIAGQGIANPLGAILCVALLLRHSLGLEPEAQAVEAAVAAVVAAGHRTADLAATAPPSGPRGALPDTVAPSGRCGAGGGRPTLSTRQMGERVLEALLAA